MKKFLIISLLAIGIYLFNVISLTYKNLHKEAKTKPLSDVLANVTVTMYNPVEEQCDADPLITAGMYRIDAKNASEHNWVAVSRNLLKRWGGKLQYGDKVTIKGAGHKDSVYVVVDTMNKRYVNRVDILETTGTKWYKFKNVQLAKL